MATPDDHRPRGGTDPVRQPPPPDLPERDPPAHDLRDSGPTAPTSAPAVVAVVVTDGTGPLVDAAVGGLAAQDYPALTILVLDRGDPTGRPARRDRIGRIASGALVRELDGPPDAVAAANDVLHTVEGATFLCFVADDVELEPAAIGQLVAEAYRSNAAVCAPKLVDRRDHNVLLEVGLGVDHYGVPFTGIEPGEVDQEQHDAVRDVFFVSDAVLLVRTDLFAALGGFDPGCAPGSHDLDLCWRARLAGARVLVVPDARARRTADGARRPDARVDSVGDAARARARTLLKLYSAPALAWIVPVATILNMAEAIGFAVTRRRRAARHVLAGWWSGLASFGRLRELRRAVQRSRRIDDRDVRSFMIRGSARARALLIRRRHRDPRLSATAGRARGMVGGLRTSLQTPDAIAGLTFLVLLAFGARRMLTEPPAFSAFARWPGLGDLLGAWGGRWRFAGLGSDTPAPGALGVFGALTAVVLGDADVARAAVVFAAAPLGAIGTYRLTRPLAPRALPAVSAMIAYGANPLVRNAYAKGALGPLMLVALAPYIARRCFTLAEGIADTRARRRSLAALAVLTAVATAVFPAALLLPFAIVASFVLAVPFVGGVRLAGRVTLAALVAALGTAVLLWPWSGTLAGSPTTAIGFAPSHPVPPGDLLAFRTGPAGAGPWPYVLLGAAALPLVIATGARFAWAVRGWMLVLVSLALAYLPTRLSADLPVPPVEGVLVPAALGLALAVGIGIGAFIAELRTFVFGLRQGLAVVCACCAVAPVASFVPDVFDGGFRAPRTTWGDSLAFLTRQAHGNGGFRLLWVGDPAVLPGGATTTGDLAYALTRNGVGDARDLLPAAPGRGDEIVAASLALARDGRTARLGHLLAPMAVRYVAIVDRAAPDSREHIDPDARLADALTTQLDLTVARRADGIVLYENEAWAPSRAIVDDVAAELALDLAGRDDPIAAATRAELAGAVPVRGAIGASAVTDPGTVLFAEQYASGWRAVDRGQVLDHRRAFGWSNAFVATEPGTVAIRYDAGGLHALRVAVPAALWFAALVLCVLGRRAPVTVATGAAVAVTAEDAVPEVAVGRRGRHRAAVAVEQFADGGEADGDAPEDLAALDALAAVPADDADFDWSVLGRDEGDER
jgi:GT2 family glycosyltransferase